MFRQLEELRPCRRQLKQGPVRFLLQESLQQGLSFEQYKLGGLLDTGAAVTPRAVGGPVGVA